MASQGPQIVDLAAALASKLQPLGRYVKGAVIGSLAGAAVTGAGGYLVYMKLQDLDKLVQKVDGFHNDMAGMQRETADVKLQMERDKADVKLQMERDKAEVKSQMDRDTADIKTLLGTYQGQLQRDNAEFKTMFAMYQAQVRAGAAVQGADGSTVPPRAPVAPAGALNAPYWRRRHCWAVAVGAPQPVARAATSCSPASPLHSLRPSRCLGKSWGSYCFPVLRHTTRRQYSSTVAQGSGVWGRVELGVHKGVLARPRYCF